MNPIQKKHLQALQKIKRSERHPLLHLLHKKHHISRKTLFYMKEYGPRSHAIRTILKESIGILLMASIISSVGGLSVEYIKKLFVTLTPFVILLPALNDLVGDYGTIISSRFSTLLYENKVNAKIWKNKEIKELFTEIMTIALLTAIFAAVIAIIISKLSHFPINMVTAWKIITITMLDVMLLVGILFFTAITAGLYFYKKKEDPNNFLIPITTSVADFGNMIMLTLLIILVF